MTDEQIDHIILAIARYCDTENVYLGGYLEEAPDKLAEFREVVRGALEKADD